MQHKSTKKSQYCCVQCINNAFFTLPGPQREFSGDPPQRAAGSGDGGHDGGVLPGLLAAVRSSSSDRDLRPS